MPDNPNDIVNNVPMYTATVTKRKHFLRGGKTLLILYAYDNEKETEFTCSFIQYGECGDEKLLRTIKVGDSFTVDYIDVNFPLYEPNNPKKLVYGIRHKDITLDKQYFIDKYDKEDRTRIVVMYFSSILFWLIIFWYCKEHKLPLRNFFFSRKK
ncbi:MAG: hypothetical protein KGV50_02905 [Gammaproteobacteria bacterium]|nr:hypothetical protein [Gammaproteobacteria bacterium]